MKLGTQEFKDLQGYWYAVIREKGFKDIEAPVMRDLPQNIRAKTRMERHARQDYYLLLSQYIKDKAPEFDDSVDYFVMYKFSVGYSNAEIVRELAKLQEPRHRKTIMYIRRKYENRWGIRKWAPHQLRSRKMHG